MFVLAMGFDLVILVATAVALMRLSARTGLWQLLLKDGLVYFLVSFTANSVPAVCTIAYSITLVLKVRPLRS